MDYKIVTECRICKSTRLKKYLDLGNQPLANSLGSNQTKYPLQVLFCEECSLSQLSITIDPKILYKDYPYHSSISKTFKKHCYELAVECDRTMMDSGLGEIKSSTVMDIAANDGCLLEQFRLYGCKNWLVAVEPSENLAKKCSDKGFDSRCEFFSKDSALPRANIITATNVFAHVDDITSFALGLRKFLAVNDGFCVIEVPYLASLINNNAFDTIYHEHLSYFLLRPIKMLFESCGLRIFKVERKDIHGGSIRIFACSKTLSSFFYDKTKSAKDYFPKMVEVSSEEVFKDDGSVARMLEYEEHHGLYDFDAYFEFSNNVENVKKEFKRLLRSLKDDGKKVMGYGASAKGCNLLNICDIEIDEINSIVDDTKDKQGKRVPGIGIPIVSFAVFDVMEPDYIILLSWNFAKELMQNTPHHKERQGKYILPIPKVEII